MVDTSFATTTAAVISDPLGGGGCAVRYCVDHPAFGGSALRSYARPKFLSSRSHCSLIPWVAASRLYHGDGNNNRMDLLRVSGSDVVTRNVGSSWRGECHYHY